MMSLWRFLRPEFGSLFQVPRWWWKSLSVIRNAINARGLGKDRAAEPVRIFLKGLVHDNAHV